MTRLLPWVKSWKDPGSVDGKREERRWLPGRAKALEPLFMTMAFNEVGSPNRGYLVRPDGTPLTAEDIASDVRLPVHEIEEPLAALERARIMERRSDGAWGFPDFERLQEDPSTARKRRAKQRENTRESPREIHAQEEREDQRDRGSEVQTYRGGDVAERVAEWNALCEELAALPAPPPRPPLKVTSELSEEVAKALSEMPDEQWARLLAEVRDSDFLSGYVEGKGDFPLGQVIAMARRILSGEWRRHTTEASRMRGSVPRLDGRSAEEVAPQLTRDPNGLEKVRELKATLFRVEDVDVEIGRDRVFAAGEGGG